MFNDFNNLLKDNQNFEDRLRQCCVDGSMRFGSRLRKMTDDYQDFASEDDPEIRSVDPRKVSLEVM